MAEGDVVVDISEPLSAEQEAEAWKIAQLAATVMAGVAASKTAVSVVEAVQAGRGLLAEARRVASST